MLSFYSNNIKNINQQPNEYWRELQQQIVNDNFLNTTLKRNKDYPLFEEVIDELNKFTFEFEENNDCWIGTVTDAIVNTEKDTSDYAEIYFQDCSHDSRRGRYYQFDDNYWITYEDSGALYETISHCKVRRCNNILKWVDEKGQYYEYPCVLDYTLMSPSNQVSKSVTTANSHVTVIVQGNKDTLALKKNDRFMFNGLAVKYIAINNYMQNDYVNQDTPLLFIEMYWDTIQDSDNLEENIADDVRLKYNVEITNGNIIQIQGYECDLQAIVTSYDEKVIEDVEFEYNSANEEIAYIDKNGHLTLVGNIGDACDILVNIKGNKLSETSIRVEICDVPITEDIQLLVEPNVKEIYLHSSKTFNAHILSNDIEQDVEVECVPSGADSDECYTFVDNGNNSWTITNNKKSKEKLKLTFTYEDKVEVVEIQLRALF